MGSRFARLHALARVSSIRLRVSFAGPVAWEDLPAYYDAGRSSAMPCRTRRRGWTVKGWASSPWRASATGIASDQWRAGGGPDAVLPGETLLCRRRSGRRPRMLTSDDPAALPTLRRRDHGLEGPRMGRQTGEWRWDKSSSPRLREIIATEGRLSAGVENLALACEIFGHDTALDFSRDGVRCPRLGESVEDPELPDRLGPRDRLVGVFERPPAAGDNIRSSGQVAWGLRGGLPCWLSSASSELQGLAVQLDQQAMNGRLSPTTMVWLIHRMSPELSSRTPAPRSFCAAKR